MGGPEPAINNPDFFKDNPFIDLVICYEGEITFKRVLQHFEQGDWESVTGFLINNLGVDVKKQDDEALTLLLICTIQNMDKLGTKLLNNVFEYAKENF